MRRNFLGLTRARALRERARGCALGKDNFDTCALSAFRCSTELARGSSPSHGMEREYPKIILHLVRRLSARAVNSGKLLSPGRALRFLSLLGCLPRARSNFHRNVTHRCLPRARLPPSLRNLLVPRLSFFPLSDSPIGIHRYRLSEIHRGYTVRCTDCNLFVIIALRTMI